jgi:sterol desaturase/sphingolipid hydroxylase (fatty acid hydroxylase superfamily)
MHAGMHGRVLRLTPENALEIRAGLFWGGLLFFLVLEYIASYRPNTVSKWARLVTNIFIAVLNGVLLNLLFWSATVSVVARVEKGHAGIVNLGPGPLWVKLAGAVILMDLVMYLWHLANHKIPLLWRFHRVHHSDMNMDVSTASRFHAGELAVSGGIKIAAISFLGIDMTGIVLFDCLLVLAAQFQHSSVKVPERFERIYWTVFVPPSMHRIHHSVVIKERDSNYGTIFSVWDRLFGTLRRNVAQERIVIGLGPYRSPGTLKVWHLLRMPFTKSVR